MRHALHITLLIFSLHISITKASQQHYPMQAHQVAPAVYAVITPTRALPNPKNRGWNSNSAFIVTKSGVVLFDTGSSTVIGHALKQTIASVTKQPVRWIINSHSHGDHWLGNEAFNTSVEKIISTRQVKDLVHDEGQSWIDRFNQMTAGITGQSKILPPNTLINKRTEMLLGDRQLILFPSGDSHSPGDLILWLPQDKVLISGDVVYSDRMPSTNASNLAQWIRQLEELIALKPKVVIPGHGNVSDIHGLERLHRLLEGFWQAVTKGYEDGKSDFEMVADVTQALSSFSADYPGLDEKIKRDISHVYLQVEAAAF